MSLEPVGLGNIAQVLGNRHKVVQNHAVRSPVSATFLSLSELNRGNISARLLIPKRSKLFPLSITLKTKVFSN